MNSTHWGGVTEEQRIIASLLFVGLSRGNTTLTLDSTGLIDTYGHPMAVRGTGDQTLSVDVSKAALTLESNIDSSLIYDIDTARIYLTNAYSLHAVMGTFSYNPSIVEILNVYQATTLNENGRSQTVFIRNIDNMLGKTTFGVARTNSNDRGLSIDVDPIASIVYRTKNPGQTSFEFTNTNLISSVYSLPLPHFTRGYNFTVTGHPIYVSDSAIVEFSPSAMFVPQDSIFSVDITADSVSNLYSFASDVYYDNTKLRFINAQEGPFLNDGGSVQTLFQLFPDTNSGRIVIGLSRAGSDSGGVTTNIPSVLLTLRFPKLNSDSTYIILDNTALLKPDGLTRIPFRYSPCFVESSFMIYTPEIPQLYYPLNDANHVDTLVTFRWLTVDNATRYRIQFSTDSSFYPTLRVNSQPPKKRELVR